jgi:hypothetical protein
MDASTKTGAREMNLISCDNCGTVLDKDKLPFKKLNIGDCFDDKNSMWDGRDWVATVPCPCCEERIPESQK